jgi:hypothetical protein
VLSVQRPRIPGLLELACLSCRDWDDEWEDSETGQTMKRFGVEVWTMRNGKIAIWAAAFNAAPAKQALTIEQTVSRWSARSDSQPILR